MESCKIEKLEKQLEEIQRELDICKNSDEHKICKIISEHSTATNLKVGYENTIELDASGFSGDLSLQKVYNQVGYHCTWAYYSHAENITHLQFTKN